VALTMLPVVSGTLAAGGAADPFTFLEPSVTLSTADRTRIDRGEIIVQLLPDGDDQLAVLAASKVAAPPERLALWTHSIAALKKSAFVQAIHRFSNLPDIADLDAVMLEEHDLQAIRNCRPGGCELKLGTEEIRRLKASANISDPSWREAVTREFRQLMLERVKEYELTGLAGLPPQVDRSIPRLPHSAFEALLSKSTYLERTLPGTADSLRWYPQMHLSGIESFFYWSKERYGSGKPVISITHVTIRRSEDGVAPAVLVTGKQIFATHYTNASLGVTAILRGPTTNYLVYINRTHLDLLGGVFGSWKQAIMGSRLKRDTPDVFRTLKARLESGLPPGSNEGGSKP
jgi:hypothetical protein